MGNLKAVLIKINRKIEGFRGLLAIFGTFVTIYLGSFFDSLTGISRENIKGAAMAAAPLALKLIWTDARPRIMAWMKPAQVPPNPPPAGPIL